MAEGLRSRLGRYRSPVRWAALALAASALFGVFVDPTYAWAPPARAGSGPAQLGKTPSRVAPSPASRGPGTNEVKPLALTGRILIPAIGVDAKVVPLYLNGDGSLQVPSDPKVAGWYAMGPFPGEPGPAVVVGHVDSKMSPGVFYGLRLLRLGDEIFIQRDGRRPERFVVVSSAWFAKDAFPTARVYGPVDGSALRLITCGGTFDWSTGHYVDNLVVFAVAASPDPA
jgi:hypothetical protein